MHFFLVVDFFFLSLRGSRAQQGGLKRSDRNVRLSCSHKEIGGLLPYTAEREDAESGVLASSSALSDGAAQTASLPPLPLTPRNRA